MTEERFRTLTIREAARRLNMPVIALLIIRPFFPTLFREYDR
jgi:hypothetical protein